MTAWTPLFTHCGLTSSATKSAHAFFTDVSVPDTILMTTKCEEIFEDFIHLVLQDIYSFISLLCIELHKYCKDFILNFIL